MSNEDVTIGIGVQFKNLQQAQQAFQQFLNENSGRTINVNVNMPGGGAGGAGGMSAANNVMASAAPTRGRSAAQSRAPLQSPVYGPTGYSTQAHRYMMASPTVLQPGYTQDAQGAFHGPGGKYASAASAMGPQAYHEWSNEQAQARAQAQVDRAQAQADRATKQSDRAVRMAQASGYVGSDAEGADEYLFNQRVAARSAAHSKSAARLAGEPAWKSFMRKATPGAYAIMTGEPGALGTYAGNFASAAMMPLGNFIGSQFSLMTQQNLTGRRDVMGEYGSTGGLIGGVLGAGIGSLFGGMGGFMGGWTGSSMGQMFGEFLGSGKARDIRLEAGLMPIGSLSANRAGDVGGWRNDAMRYSPQMFRNESYFNNPALGAIQRLSAMSVRNADLIGKAFWQPERDGDYRDYYATAEQLSSMYGSSYQALLAGGFDPEQNITATNAMQVSGWAAAGQAGRFARRSNARGKEDLSDLLIGTGGVTAGNTVAFKNRNIPLYRYLSENVAARYGASSDDVMKNILPLIAGIRSFGGDIGAGSIHPGNALDIVMKGGPVAASQLYETIAPIGSAPQFGINKFREVTGMMQTYDYRQKSAALQVRGSAATSEAIFNQQLGYLDEAMPGGRESLTYKALEQGRRGAKFQRYSEEDLGYNLLSIDLAAKQATLGYLPYSPGSGMRVALEDLQNSAAQRSVLKRRYREDMKAGDMSEERQTAAYSAIRGLDVKMAAGVAALADGGEDRVMALSAGRPSFFNKMDSRQLATLSVYQKGLPTTRYGAVGGAGLARQNRFFEALNTDSFSASDAMSPSTVGDTGSMAAGLSRNTAAMEKMTATLDRWLNSQAGGSAGDLGGGVRPTEARGREGGRLKSQSIDNRAHLDRGN